MDKMFVVTVEYQYATPSLYTRATLEEAQAKREELLETYGVCRRIGIYEFMPLSSLPGTLMELPDQWVYPEKETAE